MNRWTLVVIAGLALGACKRPKELEYETPQAKDIPREIAVAKLKEDLPTVYWVRCTLPKEKWRAKYLKEWEVDGKGVRIFNVDENKPPLEVAYSQIQAVRLYGKRSWFYVRLYTTEQTEEETEHFEFLWQDEGRAKSVMELFEALRQKE